MAVRNSNEEKPKPDELTTRAEWFAKRWISDVEASAHYKVTGFARRKDFIEGFKTAIQWKEELEVLLKDSGYGPRDPKGEI